MDNNIIPKFLIMGSDKFYKNNIFKFLNMHPDIYIHENIHFFDYYWNIMPKKWYYNMFIKSNKLIKGEETLKTLYIDNCFKRIKQTCPHTKFILFLENPIYRADYAWYYMHNKLIMETRSFNECIDYNIKNLDEKRTPYNAMYHYVQEGFYMDQIERLMKVFPNRDNILIIIIEKMNNDPNTYYNKIFKFLDTKNIKININNIYQKKSYIDDKIKIKLKNIYKSHNKRLSDFLGYSIPEWN